MGVGHPTPESVKVVTTFKDQKTEKTNLREKLRRWSDVFNYTVWPESRELDSGERVYANKSTNSTNKPMSRKSPWKNSAGSRWVPQACRAFRELSDEKSKHATRADTTATTETTVTRGFLSCIQESTAIAAVSSKYKSSKLLAPRMLQSPASITICMSCRTIGEHLTERSQYNPN